MLRIDPLPCPRIAAGGEGVAEPRVSKHEATGYSLPIEKFDDARRRRRLGLIGDLHVPVIRARQTLLEIARGRGRVRGVFAGHDQSRDVEAQQVLGLGAGRGVAVEQAARHAGHDQLVALDIHSANAAAKPASVLMTEAHGPPRGSAPNGLPFLAASATTASRPFCWTKARCSAKRW